MQGLHAPRRWREQAFDKETSLPAEMQSPVELKHVAEDSIYTDGSKKEFPNVGIVTNRGLHKFGTGPTTTKSAHKHCG